MMEQAIVDKVECSFVAVFQSSQLPWFRLCSQTLKKTTGALSARDQEHYVTRRIPRTPNFCGHTLRDKGKLAATSHDWKPFSRTHIFIHFQNARIFTGCTDFLRIIIPSNKNSSQANFLRVIQFSSSFLHGCFLTFIAISTVIVVVLRCRIFIHLSQMIFFIHLSQVIFWNE